MYLPTKDDIEKKFGKIENETYKDIIMSVHNDMQQIIDIGGIPSEQNFINILLTNIEFFYKAYDFK